VVFKRIVAAESSWEEKEDDGGCCAFIVFVDRIIVTVESFDNEPNGDDESSKLDTEYNAEVL